MNRLAVLLAEPAAVAPPGIDPDRFAAACRADCYEVIADLSGISTGVCDWPDAEVPDLWPQTRRFDVSSTADLLLGLSAAGEVDAVVLVSPDAPDLPGLVLAKVFQALGRADVAIAPAAPGPGWVGLGVTLPLPPWWPAEFVPASGHDPYEELSALAPRRRHVVRTPGWHRLDRPAAISRLDPSLEGWEQTRALLSGRPYGSF